MADETTNRISTGVDILPEVPESALKKVEKDIEKSVAQGTDKGLSGLIKGKPVTVKLKASGKEALVSDLKSKGGLWWQDVADLSARSSKAKLAAMRDALQLSAHDYEILKSRDAKHAPQKGILEAQLKEYQRYMRLLDQKASTSQKKSEKKADNKRSLAAQAARADLSIEKMAERERAKWALSDERRQELSRRREAQKAVEAAEREEKDKLAVRAKYDSARAMAQRQLRYSNKEYDWMPESAPRDIDKQASLVASLSLTEEEQTLARMSVKAKNLTEEERDQIQEAKDKLKYLKEQEKVLDKMQKAEAKDKGGSRNLLARAFGAIGSGLGKVGTDVVRKMYRLTIRDIAKELLNLAKEGIQILTDWDRNFGDNTSHAAETIDHLSAKWFELKKAVGAMAMPIIQILQPAIDWVLNAVISMVNWTNQLARAFQGYSTYMKATARVVSKTTQSAKELKKVLFGFDELNILPSENGAGAASSVMPYDYEETEIEDKISRTAQWFKDTWATIKKWWKEHISKPFSESWESIKNDAINAWDQLKESWGELKTWWQEHVSKPLNEAWGAVKEYAIGAWAQIKSEVGEVWNALKLIFEGIRDAGVSAWESIKDAWSSLTGWVENSIVAPVRDAFNGLKRWIFENVPWLAKILGIEPGDFTTTVTVNFVTDTYLSPDTRKLMDLLDMNVLSDAGRTSVQSQIRQELTRHDDYATGANRTYAWPFASGGKVPNKGSLILANEAGPEVIANMGNATGIMNTNQMQSAIISGNSVVVSALYDICNEIVRTVNSKSTDVFLDGKKVGQSVTKYANARTKATGLPAWGV